MHVQDSNNATLPSQQESSLHGKWAEHPHSGRRLGISPLEEWSLDPFRDDGVHYLSARCLSPRNLSRPIRDVDKPIELGRNLQSNHALTMSQQDTVHKWSACNSNNLSVSNEVWQTFRDQTSEFTRQILLRTTRTNAKSRAMHD